MVPSEQNHRKSSL